VEAKALARASAARLCASLLLVLPLPNVIRPRRVSILTTVVKCHLPPRADSIPLRFNSSANARCETKPFAFSSRTVGTKARARESAQLFACSASAAAHATPMAFGTGARERRRRELPPVSRHRHTDH